jgi:dCTP deaminase
MIINGASLLDLAPIKDMLPAKVSKVPFPTSYGLGELGYDIRIKQDITFFTNEEGNWIIVTDPMTKESKYLKGRFCLASSVEEFQMPNTLGAIGHDKSTWARLGVQVFNTVIEPGWNGFLTIELVFNGEERVHIPAGTGIMQVIFHRPLNRANYVGKYQDQANEPVAAKT